MARRILFFRRYVRRGGISFSFLQQEIYTLRIQSPHSGTALGEIFVSMAFIFLFDTTMKNTPPTNTTEPTPSCAGKMSQESVRLNRKTTQDATTLEILQADQSIDNIPA